MPFRAIVFDLFDTLVDLRMEGTPRSEWAGRTVPRSVVDMHALVSRHREVEPDRFMETFREIDRELRESRYAKHLEVPSDMRFGAFLDRLGLEAHGLTDELVGIHMDLLRGQVRNVDHHPEVLDQLADRARIGLCSNFSHSPTALRVLDESGLRGHLDAIVISDEVGIRKPRGEIFEAVLGELGVSPSETLHVGDNLDADVRGAAALGIRTAWITRRVGDPAAKLAEFDGPRPDFEIADLAELVAILESA